MPKKEKAIQTPEDAEEFVSYEIGYHLIPIVGEDGVADEVGKIREAVEKQGGVLTADQFPTRLPLAYEMHRQVQGSRQRFTEAYFGWMRFELPASQIAVVKNALDANEHVLRFIVVHTRRGEGASSTVSIVRPAGVQREGDELQVESQAVAGDKELSDDELEKTIDELVIE